ALERSLVLFDEAGERNGKLAAQSFLALIRPEDPRVTDWLGDALRHAEEVGDRSGQCNARVLLAWHHTFRSYFGGPADIAAAESSDPVAWMGWLAVAEALVLAGRFDEAMSVLSDDRTLPVMSALDGMTRGLLRGLFLTLTGRPADARPFLESARASADAVRARPGEQAATAVLAEIEARVGGGERAAALLDDVGTTTPDSVAGVLAL